MKKQLIAGLLLAVALAVVIALRVRAQNAAKLAPSGGSTSLEGTDSVVATKVGGRLVEVLVREGDPVVAGQVVARLDCEDQEAAHALALARVKQAEAQIALAEAGVTGAKEAANSATAQVAVVSARAGSVDVQRKLASRERERATTLALEGAAPKGTLDHAETAEQSLEAETRAAHATIGAASLAAKAQQATIGSAGAQVEVARAGLELARVDEERTKTLVAECALKAPSDGTIVGRLHEPGAVLGPGARVLTMVDLSVMKATFYLPNAELGRAQPGADAELRVDAYLGEVFRGTVRHVASEAEFTPRNVQTREDRDRLVYAVEIQLDNPGGRLRAGMPAEVLLPGTGP